MNTSQLLKIIIFSVALVFIVTPQLSLANKCFTKETNVGLFSEDGTTTITKKVPIWNPSCLFKMVAQEAGYTTDIDAEPTTIAEKLGVAMGMVLSFLGTIFVILIIYGGFLWMTARGNEEQSKKAKNIIRDAVIGVIIILASGTIMYFIMMLPTINFQPA